MAGHFYYDDTEITDDIELPKALVGGFAQSFNGGAIGSSGIAINDIAGSLNIVGFHRWKYTEDTATPTRVAGGYIGARKISKADVFEAPGVARVWDCDLMDLNVLAGLLVCRGDTAKRPTESDVERIQDYLLSDTGSGFYDSINHAWLVFDNGGVHTAHPLGHDEDDLRGKYPEEVLQSITWDRRVTCLYWDDAASSGEEPSLWWAPPEDVRGAITQKLSNNPAHINGTTVFAAFEGQAVARDPTGITSGAYLTTRLGTIYRTNPLTSAAFISRDRVYQTDLIGRSATAEALAVEMLAFGSAELDVVTCSIEVAAADVNIFREGYSVQAEFTHLPGYETYQTLTIYNRIIRRPEGMIARYVLDLTLSASAPKSTGGTGGSPGDFPHDPDPPGPEVTIDVCNTVIEDSVRDGTTFGTVLAVEGDEWYFEISQTSHTAGAKVTGIHLDSSGVIGGTLYDFLPLWTPTEIGTGAGSPALPLKTGTFTIGTQTLGGPTVMSLTVSADYLGPGVTVDECFHLEMWRGTSAPTVEPPLKGQAFGPTSPVETPDGVITTFTLPAGYEFADRSLRVYVNRLDQTLAVTSYDGAARTFTLAFSPKVGWLIECYGIGR